MNAELAAEIWDDVNPADALPANAGALSLALEMRRKFIEDATAKVAAVTGLDDKRRARMAAAKPPQV